MNVLLRRIMPVGAGDQDEDENVGDDLNAEYSFATEYKGPLVGYEIPHVVPVDIERIPTAAAVVNHAFLTDFPVPVVRPILRRVNGGRMCLAGSDFVAARLVEIEKYGSNSVLEDEEGEDCGLDGDLVHRNRRKKILRGDGMDEMSDASGSLKNGKLDARKSSDGSGNTDSLGFSGDTSGSCGLSGSSDVVEVDSLCERKSLDDFVEQLSSSSGGGSLSRSVSLETYSCVDVEEQDHDHDDEEPIHVRKPSVTFLDGEPAGIEIDCFESDSEDGEFCEVRKVPAAERKGKKGSCYRCFKGNRWTNKEVCFVCSAKFCSKCVLKMMGDMSEGRKCIICIGFPINESRRGSLGKPSWLLKRLLTESQLKQVMTYELTSKANQLIPELISVNGRPLTYDEMSILHSCKWPPKGLQPGKYWYDRESGLWGKEGEKPSQIISPHLTVGDEIKPTASNGTTNVLINSRVITKSELLMLQMAGVECEGNPHFWVTEDGSYLEEGQNYVKGKIWDKAGMKLVCALLSLPFPIGMAQTGNEVVDIRVDGERPDQLKKSFYKLLMVGYSKSGTSTLHKQAKILYNVPFSEDERQQFKSLIQFKLYKYLAILLQGRKKFEEESLIEEESKQSASDCDPSGDVQQSDVKTVYTLGGRLEDISNWLVSIMLSGDLEAIFPASTREYSQYVEELWKHAAVKATYKRRSEIEMLPRIASYFLDRAAEISMADYEPSDKDILYAEGLTSSNGISSIEFTFPKSPSDGYLEASYKSDLTTRYQLIRLHTRALGEHCKWVEMFEDIDLVIFCVSLTDYCQLNDDGTNKMQESKKLFESMITQPTLADKQFLLILNKFDLLEETIESFPLTQCDWFSDFNPVISKNSNSKAMNHTNPSLAHRAFTYIAVKFKRLYESIVESDRKLYVSAVTGLEPKSVDDALRYASHILRWQEEKPSFSNNENSSYSIEASSTS
ncbi:unnamed protein product [Rhodiola kirilowii]